MNDYIQLPHKFSCTPQNLDEINETIQWYSFHLTVQIFCFTVYLVGLLRWKEQKQKRLVLESLVKIDGEEIVKVFIQ